MSRSRSRETLQFRSVLVLLFASVLFLLAPGCGGNSSREERVSVLLRMIHNPIASERLAAIRELGRMREKRAVVALIRLLREPRSDVRVEVAAALGEIRDPRAVAPLIEVLKPPHEWTERKAAAEALGKIGDPAATEALVAALRDEKDTVAFMASEALGAVGAPAVGPVVETFRAGSNAVRVLCANAIVRVRDRCALPALRAMVADPAPELRLAAAQALCGLRDTQTMDRVVALLEDKAASVPKGVKDALTTAGTAAVPWLAKGLQAGGEADATGLQTTAGRLAATDVVGGIGGPLAVRALLGVLSHGDASVRDAARKRLDKLRKAEPSSSRELLAVIGEGRFPLALNALRVLSPVGDTGTVHSVVGALRGNDERIRCEAATVLGRIPSAAAIEPLASALNDDAVAVRVTAAAALARRGDDRGRAAALTMLRESVDRLRSGQTPADERGREGERNLVALSVETVARVKERAAGGPLLALLKYPDPGVVALAVDALGETGETNATAELIRRLEGTDADAVCGAVRALGKIRDARAVPALVARLDSADPEIVRPTLEALGRIGHESALDPLLQRLDTADEARKREVIAALGYLGDARAIPRIVPLLDPLFKRLKDEAADRAEDHRLRSETEAWKEKDEAWQKENEGWQEREEQWQKSAKEAKEKRQEPPPRPALPPRPPRPERKTPGLRGRGDFKTALQAIEALGDIGHPDAIAPLARVIAGTLEPSIHEGRIPEKSAVEALAKIGGDAAFAALTEAFGRVSVHRFFHSTRTRVMRAVVRADKEKAVPVLAKALEESEPMDYEGVASLLEMAGEIGNTNVFGVLVGYLRHDIASVREKALNAFAAIGSRDVKRLIDYMEGVSVGFRSYVCLVFPRVGPQAVAPLAEALASGRAPEVRQGAAWALGHMAAAEGVEPLMRAMKEDPDSRVKGGAIWALGEIGDKRALDTVMDCLKNADETIRAAAATALGQFADRRARDPLIASLQDDKASVRAATATALGRMDDPGVRSALQSAFRDASAEVRAAANRSLKGLLEASRPNPTGGHAAGTNQVARRPDGKTARLR